MSNKKSVKKNYLYNLTYTLLNTVLPLVTAPHLARTVGASGVGTYAYFYAIAHTFYIFCKLGVTNYGTRHIANVSESTFEKRSYIFSSIYYQQLFTTCLSGIIYLLFCLVILHDHPDQKYALLFTLSVFSGIFDIDWLHAGMENFKSISRKNIIVKIISVCLVFGLVQTPSDLWKYMLIMSLSSFLGYCTLWIERKKFVRFCKVAKPDILHHIKPNLILVVPVFAINVYRSMDKIMLGSISGAIETGLYENAEKIVYALCGFITAFGTVMMPRTAQMLSSGKQKQSLQGMVQSMQFMMYLLWGMAFGLAAISDDLIIILFGIDFARAAPLMTALAFTLPFIGWANVVRTQYVIPMHIDKLYLLTVSVGACINLAVNVILIPAMGAMGAICGTLCAEASIPVTQYLLLRKVLPFDQFFKKTFFAPIIGVIMYFIIQKFCTSLHPNIIINLSLQIIIGATFFAICVLFLFGLQKFFIRKERKSL